MFKKLLLTELDANKNILLISLALNLVFFVYMTAIGSDLAAFIAATMVSFWVLLIIAASTSGHEKRGRLMVQLPVIPSHVFGAGWCFVLCWLAVQVLVWGVFGVTNQEDFTLTQFGEITTFACGMITFVLIVAIGIDLGSYRPAYVQWLYIVFMLALLGIAIRFEIYVGVIGNDEGMHFYPIALVENLTLEILLSFLLIAFLLAADFLVFRFSDNYLD